MPCTSSRTGAVDPDKAVAFYWTGERIVVSTAPTSPKARAPRLPLVSKQPHALEVGPRPCKPILDFSLRTVAIEDGSVLIRELLTVDHVASNSVYRRRTAERDSGLKRWRACPYTAARSQSRRTASQRTVTVSYGRSTVAHPPVFPRYFSASGATAIPELTRPSCRFPVPPVGLEPTLGGF